jgi:hypothetical protein
MLGVCSNKGGDQCGWSLVEGNDGQ